MVCEIIFASNSLISHKTHGEEYGKNRKINVKHFAFQANVKSYYQHSRVWMDTWTERKVLNRKFPSKNEKSWHKHMKQIILPSTVLEFTWLAIDGFMEENGLASLSQKGN